MSKICAECNIKYEREGISVCPKCGGMLRVNSSIAMPTLVGDAAELATPGSSSRRLHAVGVPKVIEGYEILKVLGSGGMGTVYLAYEPLLDRKVALKLLARSEDEKKRTQQAARFLSECVLTGRLCHAGIVPIYQVGYDQKYGYYYTMRYIKGRTLGDILQSLANRDAQTLEEFNLTRRLNVFLRVCEAIAFAHRHGVVHRDIKPSNIIVADFGEVLVLDWGLAKDINRPGDSGRNAIVDEDAQRIAELRRRRGSTTQMFLLRDRKPPGGTSVLKQLRDGMPAEIAAQVTDEQILGTPGFLSPEQGECKALTAASDVYSLGVTLYEILTLRRPLESADPVELIAMTIAGQITPIKKRPEAVSLPDLLCDITTKALSLNPAERYSDAKEMAEDMAAYLQGKAPLKQVTKDAFNEPMTSDIWSVQGTSVTPGPEGTALGNQSAMRCNKVARGDFRCDIEFWAESISARWIFTIGILEVLAHETVEPRFELRMGVEDRPFVELLRNGERVQRRFDVRLQSQKIYVLHVELENDYLRLWIDGRKYIDYKEVFPQTGGAVELRSRLGQFRVTRFKLASRGAPLSLSFMVLPDRLYRTGRYAEARELYRHLADSHSDREEGLIALYKAGLCSTAMQDLRAAFAEFTKLEGTMYGHCCALGLAQIGMHDGDIDWAWEALKNGYRRHSVQEIRNEMWFSLLELVERLDESRSDEKIKRYVELLTDLEPEGQEAGRLAFDLLDAVHKTRGVQALRAQCIDLLRKFPRSNSLQAEALLALSRSGIDGASLAPVNEALERVMRQPQADTNVAKFHILKGEVLIASDKLDDAIRELRDAILSAGPLSTDGLWAKGWQILCYYLKKEYGTALTEVHETFVRYRKLKVSQMAYFQLLEALCYLARKQEPRAMASLQQCAEIDCIWGLAAQHCLNGGDPETFVEMAAGYGVQQIVEAAFLAGEVFRRQGNDDMAQRYYRCSREHPVDRAIISRLVKKHLLV